MPQLLIDIAPPKATILFHLVAPFKKGGGGGHRDVGYNSSAQSTVDAQLDTICRYGRGLPHSRLGVMLDWYGPKHTSEPQIDRTFPLLLEGCERRGMWASLCFDQGISPAKDPVAMIEAFEYAKQEYFSSPAFLRDVDGRLLVTEFTATYADWPTISKRYGAHVLHWDGGKQDGYSWIKPSPHEPNPKARMVTDNANAYMAFVCPGFNDASPANASQSAWKELGSARSADYDNGAFWRASWDSAKGALFVQVVTGNDAEEGTDVLRNLGFNPGNLPLLPTGDAIPNVNG